MWSRVETALACSTFFRVRGQAEQRYGVRVKAMVIHEAGLDGFWIHRLLLANGIESHVVDAASIAVDRRHRRAKTDSIDGETVLRTLMTWVRGERRVCSMVRVPSPEEEDRRRLARERGTLLKERISIPIGLGACSAAKASGITTRFGEIDLNALIRTHAGGGTTLPRRGPVRPQPVASPHLAATAARGAANQRRARAAAAVEGGRSAENSMATSRLPKPRNNDSSQRSDANSRPMPLSLGRWAAYAGLAPSPWQSGGVERDQGISRSGNRRV